MGFLSFPIWGWDCAWRSFGPPALRYNMLKIYTKYPHGVLGEPTLKDEECFRNGLVRRPYDRSLHERTFLSEPFIEKHAISTELSNVNEEKHTLKSHVCRRDRQPSRIPIRSLKSLRNKISKVREFVYARIFSCIPMSSALWKKGKVCIRANVAHQAGAYPGFRSMKRLGVFLLPPGWDASPSQGYPQH